MLDTPEKNEEIQTRAVSTLIYYKQANGGEKARILFRGQGHPFCLFSSALARHMNY